MKIARHDLERMFEVADVNQHKLYSCLREMGTTHIKKEYRHRWSYDNPTSCYCYVVSEMIYWYKSPNGTVPYKLVVPNDPALHRFLLYPTHDIVDLTAEQFDHYELIDYGKAKKSMFLQTGCKGPSKRARVLAELMGYENVIK